MEKIKTDAGRLFLVSKMKKSLNLAKYTEHFFFIIKTKSSPSTSVFIFSNIYQIMNKKMLKTKDFGHKHVETGLNCSHELSIFLKYHMPLRYTSVLRDDRTNIFLCICLIFNFFKNLGNNISVYDQALSVLRKSWLIVDC